MQQDKYWKTRRRLNLIVFVIQEFLCGMEYSIAYLTTWFYIKSLVIENQQRELFLTAVSSAYYVASTGCLILVSKVYRTRPNIRKIYLLGNLFGIAGNFIYSLGFSPWLLILGRFLAGAIGSMVPVAYAEVCQFYEADEISSKITLITASFAAGTLFAPIFNFAFENVNITISSWHLTYVNAPALTVSCMLIAMEILVFALLYDLPTEIKEKDSLIKLTNKKGGIKQNKLVEKFREITSIFLHDFFDIGLVLFISFFQMFIISTVELWFPVLATEVLNYNITEVNIIRIASGIVGFLLLIWISVYTLSPKGYVYLAIVTVILIIILEYTFVLLRFGHILFQGTVILWLVYACAMASIVILQNVCLANFLATITSSKKASLANGVRMVCSRSGSLLGLLTALELYLFMAQVAMVTSMICFVLAVFILIRRNTLACRKVLSTEQQKRHKTSFGG